MYKKFIVAMIVFSFLLMLGCDQVQKEEAPAIKMENMDEIEQVQLNTMRFTIDEFKKTKLDSLAKDLEATVPVDTKEMQIPEEFMSILLLREDGEKEVFCFFEQEKEWYMEHEGSYYSGADFIENYIKIGDATRIIEENDYDFKDDPERLRGLLEATKDIERLEPDQIFSEKVEQKFGITVSEQEIEKFIGLWKEDILSSENVKGYQSLFAEYETNIDELAEKCKKAFAEHLLSIKLHDMIRKEYMVGKDSVGGTSYDTFEEYYRVFLKEEL